MSSQRPQIKKASPLEKQQKIWYKKLKDSGFRDIEYANDNIENAVPNFLRRRQESYQFHLESVEAYYSMASHFLHNHEFSSPIEKTIWEYHANGLSITDICDILQKAKVKKHKRSKIHEIVQDLVKTMKAKYLLP